MGGVEAPKGGILYFTDGRTAQHDFMEDHPYANELAGYINGAQAGQRIFNTRIKNLLPDKHKPEVKKEIEKLERTKVLYQQLIYLRSCAAGIEVNANPEEARKILSGITPDLNRMGLELDPKANKWVVKGGLPNEFFVIEDAGILQGIAASLDATEASIRREERKQRSR
jgi:hypothetical protein